MTIQVTTGSIQGRAVDPTRYTAGLTVGAADNPLGNVFSCGYCRAIFCNGGGTLFVQRRGDAAPLPYTVLAGTLIEGIITFIGGQTNFPTASALSLVLEV